MRDDVLRYSRWIGLALLVTLLLASGCTRAKSSSPPTATTAGGAPQAGTETPGGGPTATSLSGADAISATGTAWANETATAEAEPAVTRPTATKSPTPRTAAPTAATQAPAVAQPTSPPPQPALPSEQAGVHVVQAGENLFRIALKYGLSYQRLAAFNGITNPHVIRVGQEIKIPPSGEPGITPVPGEKVHVVKAGENLFRIALSYGMSYERLADANGLAYPYLIYVGQRLIIP